MTPTPDAAESESQGEKILDIAIWPHRSMSRGGFAWVMIGATLAASLPLFALLGAAAFWFVGGFLGLDLLLLFGLIQATYAQARVHETFELWPDRLRVTRTERNGDVKVWEANPHWVRVALHSTRRIEGYLVLSAYGQDVELGAFLTPPERRELADAIRRGLADAARAAALGD